MTMKKSLVLFGALILLGVILVACGGAPQPPAPTAAPTQAPVSTATEVPMTIPNLDAFKASGHANDKAEAFHHWDSASPAEVPVACAKCHTSAGFQEFASTGQVTKSVSAPGGTLACETCHNDAAEALTSVTFPSGQVVNTSG